MTLDNISWQGFHHVATIARDLDATIAFYRDVLGMQIGEIHEARGGKTRHCFITPGTTRAWGLHVWESTNAEMPPLPESLTWQQPDTIMAGLIQHIAFTLPDEEAGLALRERLRQHGSRFSDIVDFGGLRSLTFLDNNGTMLEAIWTQP
ncbi:VOC family protein [Ktedonospora formicarum]|uniref:VOC domain-containing protein n=1 Tax=Ktedonospora formicarum TaxID=2778364 RepID=A0A8J3I6G6_9CHLR|nr:VOC family protein [Ktedonospora formicarum]GHO46264.1 hypothetical protein KSX_44270 [Ktedonospora formicarum]